MDLRSKFILPFTAPRCSHCGRPIVRASELKGRLWLRNGQPIHTLCLLLNYPKSGTLDYRKIAHQERERYDRDVTQRDDLENKKERQRLFKIAAESQQTGDAPPSAIPQPGRN